MSSGAKCRSCGAEIVWVKTVKGRSHPLEAQTMQRRYVDVGDGVYRIKAAYESHFAHCPDKKSWRPTGES